MRFPGAGRDNLATALKIRISSGGEDKKEELIAMPTVISFTRSKPFLNRD